jgi:glycerol kinase
VQHVLALDQGTTSSRAIVVDRDGRIVATAQRELRQIFPRPGWVEHDPREIWETQAGTAAEALERAGLRAGDVAAVGITNQRETVVLWDRATGEPVSNAVVWQDRRTAPMCDRLRADGAEDLVRHRTGLLLDPYFSGTKIAWLLENVPGVRARAEAGELAFGTVDCWLAWKLAGGALHVTDASNASRTLLFDIHAGNWDDELLALFGVPRSLLPEVRASSEVYGRVAEGLPAAGAPLAALVGDQQSATMGQLCVEPGMAKCTYGTGCFLLSNTGTAPRVSPHRLLTTVAWRRDGVTTYALEGSAFIGGAIVQWLRDGLKIVRDSSEVEALARSVEDNGGVYLVPALAGLGAPHWDPYARGTIVGITRGTTHAHVARAALEGIAYQVADLVTAMGTDADIRELHVDGGAARNDLLMQFQADVLGVPVIRPKVLETTALGAAYLAGLATGVWKSTAELAEHREIDRRFDPAMPEADARALRARWSRAVERAKAWEEGAES